MPIKGLTDREAAFPRIGILRKGAPKAGNQPGKDLTYFRFTSGHPEVEETFRAVYGEQPKDINIFLPYMTAGQNFSTWREERVAGGLVHRCDGETCVVWRDRDGSYRTDPKPCPGGCKPVGRLSVIIPELKRLAFVTVLTTSVHDIMTLTENLIALESLRGDLRGIPLVLRRRPRMVSTPVPKSKKRVRREKWLLTVEAAPQWVALQLAVQQAAALPQLLTGAIAELETPSDDDDRVTIDSETGEILSTHPQPEAAAQAQAPHHRSKMWKGAAPDPTTLPTEPEPEPEPDPEPPPPPPSNKTKRPLDAETIRAVVRKKAGWKGSSRLDSEPITGAQVGDVDDVLTSAIKNNSMSDQAVNDARHAVMEYLFNVNSTKSLTKREASAMLDWLTVIDGLELNGYARSEAAAVLAAWEVEHGQHELPLPADMNNLDEVFPR